MTRRGDAAALVAAKVDAGHNNRGGACSGCNRCGPLNRDDDKNNPLHAETRHSLGNGMYGHDGVGHAFKIGATDRVLAAGEGLQVMACTPSITGA